MPDKPCNSGGAGVTWQSLEQGLVPLGQLNQAVSLGKGSLELGCRVSPMLRD